MNLKPWLPLIIGGVIGVAGFGTYSVIDAVQRQEIAEQETKINELKNRTDALSVNTATKVTKLRASATGVNAERVAEDDVAVSDLLKFVFTWDSLEKYNQVRNELKSKYGVNVESNFLKVIMPEIEDEVIEDKHYNKIDTLGYNIEYSNMKSYVMSVDKESYTYFTIVTLTTKSANGGSASFDVALTYSTNSTHQVFDLDGYVLS